jgi:hypothetical protein
MEHSAGWPGVSMGRVSTTAVFGDVSLENRGVPGIRRVKFSESNSESWGNAGGLRATSHFLSGFPSHNSLVSSESRWSDLNRRPAHYEGDFCEVLIVVNQLVVTFTFGISWQLPK